MSSPTLRWLADQTQRLYPDAQPVYALVAALLAAFPALRPRSDVYTYDDGRTQLLLCIHGLLPITYRAVTYHIPLALWLPRGFPAKEPPLVYVVPTQDMLVRPANHLDRSGRVHHLEALDRWTTKPEGASLVSTVQDLQGLFSAQPPLYAKPKQPEAVGSDVQAIRPIQEPQPGPSSGPPVPSRPPAVFQGPTAHPVQSGTVPYHLQHQYPSAQPAYTASPQSQSQSPLPSQPQSQNSTPPPPPPPPPYPHSYARQRPPVQVGTPPVPPASVGPGSALATATAAASPAPPPPPRPADYPYSLTPHLSHTAAAIAPKPAPAIPQGPPSVPPPLPASPYQHQHQYSSNPQAAHYASPYTHPGVSPPVSSPQSVPPIAPTSVAYHAASQSPPPALPPPIIAPAPVIAAAIPVASIPNLMDDLPSTSPQYALVPSASTPSLPNAPPRPLNPYTHTLHTTLHAKFHDAMQVLVYQMHGPDNSAAADPNTPSSDLPSRPSTRTSLLNTQRDLLTGSSAIADEIARLRAVRDVCLAVSSRLRESVTRAEAWVTNVRARWAHDRDRRFSQPQYGSVSPGRSQDDADQAASVDPPVDELLVAGSIVHNQLINLVAEDNAIEDTIYHLHRALNAGRLDLERFLRTTRLLAEEQYAKRALIEKILRGLGQAPVTGPGFLPSGGGNGLGSVDSRVPVR